MPLPSSATRISRRPPASTVTSMRDAPASSAFSTSSLTAAAGRSTTSPAAMRSTSTGSRRRIGMARNGPFGVSLDRSPSRFNQKRWSSQLEPDRPPDDNDQHLLGIEEALCYPRDVTFVHGGDLGIAAIEIIHAQIVELRLPQLAGALRPRLEP